MKDRQMIIYPKNGRGQRSSAEKWGVAKLKENQREDRLLLVVGTGRCGTSTIYQMLNKCGVKVGHEKTGPDGVVSHYFCVDSDWHPMAPWQKTQQKKHVGERRSDFNFDQVWHVVRHPLKVIPSMVKIFGGLDWEYYEANGVIPGGVEPAIHRAMHTYFGINTLCQRINGENPREHLKHTRFRIESLNPTFWAQLMGFLGRGHTEFKWPGEKHANKGSGFRKSEPATWSDLNFYNPSLTREIRKMAIRYGYEV